MQERYLSVDEVSRMLNTMETHGRTAVVDWSNRTIRVLSALKPTLKKDGTRLVLSDGPAFHREVLFELHQSG